MLSHFFLIIVEYAIIEFQLCEYVSTLLSSDKMRDSMSPN